MSPKPMRRHQQAVARLWSTLDEQLPSGWEAVLDFEVIVQPTGPATVRVPDLVVVRVGGPQERVVARDVLIAVEVISRGSRNVDRWLKLHEYAEAGISHYWVIDLDPPKGPTLTEFGLDSSDRNYAAPTSA